MSSSTAANLTTFINGFLTANHNAQNIFDIAILVLHEQFIYHKYKCVAIADTKKEEWRELSSPPIGWNTNSTDSYTFVYCPPASSSPPSSSSATSSNPSTSSFSMSSSILVKALVMNSTLILHVAIRDENDKQKNKILSIEVQVEDFVKEEVICNSTTDETNSAVKYVCKDLDGLITLYDSAIFSKIIQPQQQTNPSTNPQSRPIPSRYDDADNDPLRIPSRNPTFHPFYRDDDDDFVRRPFNDLDPVGPSAGGNLMGPRNFPYPSHPYRPDMDGRPGMMPRFDPYGPMPGMGNPDFDELTPPGMGPRPARNPPGIGDPSVNPFPQRPGGRFGGGPNFGGPGFGGPGFGGGGGFI